jgi:nucleoside-triphosphatase
MALIVFLTGVPGVGKSTVVSRIAENLKSSGMTVGGMTTGDLRSQSSRVGFEIRDLLSGQCGTLAHVNQRIGPSIGKYRVNSEDLDQIGAEAILSAVKQADLILVDEVGPMELTSLRFKDAVKSALECGKPVLGTVHRNAQDALVKRIKESAHIEVIEVNNQNRQALPAILAERFKKSHAAS